MIPKHILEEAKEVAAESQHPIWIVYDGREPFSRIEGHLWCLKNDSVRLCRDLPEAVAFINHRLSDSPFQDLVQDRPFHPPQTGDITEINRALEAWQNQLVEMLADWISRVGFEPQTDALHKCFQWQMALVKP